MIQNSLHRYWYIFSKKSYSSWLFFSCQNKIVTYLPNPFGGTWKIPEIIYPYTKTGCGLMLKLLDLSHSWYGIDWMTLSCWLKSLLAGWSRRETLRLLHSLFCGSLLSCTFMMLKIESRVVGIRMTPNCLSFIINLCKIMLFHL